DGSAARRRPAEARAVAAPGRPSRLGARRDRGLLQDLHPRRLRDRALPQADVSAGRAETGAHLPLSLLHLRSREGRSGAIRPGRKGSAAAAARDRPDRRAPCRRELFRRGRPFVVGRSKSRCAVVIRRLVRYFDERTGGAPFVRKALRYVFPDHWSILLGEVALYAFVVLVVTGISLTLFFKPSLATVPYHGEYVPLHGREMSEAYKSTVDISLRVKAGLLI